MFKKFRQEPPLATSLLLAAIPTAVMMAILAFPMYSRWNSAAFARNIISTSHGSLYLAGEAALLWVLWTAFVHRGGAACAALFALFLTLEFAPTILCGTPTGPWEFSYLCLFPAFWTLTACVLAIPVRRRVAVWARRLWAIVPFFGILQYLIYFSYVLRFGRRPGAEALMTILSTNFAEARDFLTDQIGLIPIAAGLVVICAAWLVVRTTAHRIRPMRRAAVLCVLCALCFGAVLCVRNHAPWIEKDDLIHNFKRGYLQYQEVLNSLKKAQSDPSRQIANLNVSKEGNGEVCVIVIGESASRLHMSRYGYERPTTPWLCSEDENLQASLFVLENAYSCMTHTSPAVTMALSQFSNYDPVLQISKEQGKKPRPYAEIIRAFSLIEILESAGVRTYWFSNQPRVGLDDNLISIQSRVTREQVFLADIPQVDRENGHQDEELLPLLDRVLNYAGGHKCHVIFLHLRGSHWVYKNDAPADWPYLPPVCQDNMKRETAERVDAYDRSISYTDFILSRIARALKESKFSVASMLYFSDHGEDVTGVGHNFDAFRPVMTEIPVVIWLSEGYRDRWPETAAQLRANEKRIFTNDLICELALGLNHISCDNIVPERQLTSPHYGVTAENARFWNGVLLKTVIPKLKD